MNPHPLSPAAVEAARSAYQEACDTTFDGLSAIDAALDAAFEQARKDMDCWDATFRADAIDPRISGKDGKTQIPVLIIRKTKP